MILTHNHAAARGACSTQWQTGGRASASQRTPLTGNHARQAWQCSHAAGPQHGTVAAECCMPHTCAPVEECQYARGCKSQDAAVVRMPAHTAAPLCSTPHIPLQPHVHNNPHPHPPMQSLQHTYQQSAATAPQQSHLLQLCLSPPAIHQTSSHPAIQPWRPSSPVVHPPTASATAQAQPAPQQRHAAVACACATCSHSSSSSLQSSPATPDAAGQVRSAAATSRCRACSLCSN
jgi:hypothetical protein